MAIIGVLICSSSSPVVVLVVVVSVLVVVVVVVVIHPEPSHDKTNTTAFALSRSSNGYYRGIDL